MAKLGNGGSPIPDVTLTKVIFWDPATPIPLVSQNGDMNTPFSVLQDAVDACGPTGGVLVCVGTGDVAQSFTFDGAGVNNTLDIIALRGNDSRNPVRIDTATLQNHCHVTAQGIHFSQVAMTNARIWARDCNAGAVSNDAGNVRWSSYQAATPNDTSTPWALGNVNCTPSGTLALFGMKVAGNISIGGAVATLENAIQQCDLVGGPGFSLFVANPATTVYIDQFSMARARAQNFNLGLPNNTGILTLLDRPLTPGLVFVVPALAAAFADVTVALAGARPGDTFDIAPNPAAILAAVAPVAAWSPAANQITVRFFGTTAGGNYQLDVNVNANSGN